MKKIVLTFSLGWAAVVGTLCFAVHPPHPCGSGAIVTMGSGVRTFDAEVALPNGQPVLVHFVGLTDEQVETPHRLRFWLNGSRTAK